MLVTLGRSERRTWGSVYVRGLLAAGGCKATASMVARVSDGNVQAMQQFIRQSRWPWDPLRKGLAHRLVEALHLVAAWVVEDTWFPKKGDHSVWGARQYSGTLGKIGNCQVAVSLHYATDDAAVPLDFALYLPLKSGWRKSGAKKRASQKGHVPAQVGLGPGADRPIPGMGGAQGRERCGRGLRQHNGSL